MEESEDSLAQTDLDAEATVEAQDAGQSMPTINIIDNNRNMTGVAPGGGGGGGGCGGGAGPMGMGGMGGVPFQAAAAPQGGMMNSLGATGANMGGMGQLMSGSNPVN